MHMLLFLVYSGLFLQNYHYMTSHQTHFCGIFLHFCGNDRKFLSIHKVFRSLEGHIWADEKLQKKKIGCCNHGNHLLMFFGGNYYIYKGDLFIFNFWMIICRSWQIWGSYDFIKWKNLLFVLTFITNHVWFTSYSECSNWRRILKLLSNFRCLFIFAIWMGQVGQIWFTYL